MKCFLVNMLVFFLLSASWMESTCAADELRDITVPLKNKNFYSEMRGQDQSCSSEKIQCNLPSLGAPINLGDGYDYREGKAITGDGPWRIKTIEEYVHQTDNHDKRVELIQETSSYDRAKRLEIGADMEVNVMSGMVNVGGGGNYLTSEKESSTSLRFVIDFDANSYFRSVQYWDLPVDNEHFCKIESDSPTHVITAIQYGTKAFLLLEREVSITEHEHEVAVWMNAAIKGVTRQVEASTSYDEAVTKTYDSSSISLTFLGNSNNVDTPTKLEDIDTFIDQLDESARDNPQPVSFTITNIEKICTGATAVFSSIQNPILEDIAKILRKLADNELRVKSLLKKKISRNEVIKKALDENYRESYGYKLKEFGRIFKQNLTRILISTRSEAVENDTALEGMKNTFYSNNYFSPPQSDNFLSYLENQITRFDFYYNIPYLYVDESQKTKCNHPTKRDTFTFSFNCLPKSNLATQFFDGTLDTKKEWIPTKGSQKFSTFKDEMQRHNMDTTCFFLDFKAFNSEQPVTFKLETFDGTLKEERNEFIDIPKRSVSTSNNRNVQWRGADNYGDNATCPDNSFAVGACAGGYRRDCRQHNSDYVHGLFCSEPNDPYHIKIITDNCQYDNSRHGDNVDCRAMDSVVHSSCSSGGKFNCQKGTGDGKISNVIKCCSAKLENKMNLKIGRCDEWQYGEHGEILRCRHGYVITGRCGSGRRNDCRVDKSKKLSHGIQCCEMIIE